jgi:cytoskeletal protein CcmA (bactofilin family)
MAKEETRSKPTVPDHLHPPQASRLGSTLSFNGSLEGQEDAVIEGRYKGKISLPSNSLTIGRGAKVEAEVRVRNLIVHGQLTGNVNASERALISETAQMSGDIQTAKISISNGARFKGGIKIEKG